MKNNFLSNILSLLNCEIVCECCGSRYESSNIPKSSLANKIENSPINAKTNKMPQIGGPAINEVSSAGDVTNLSFYYSFESTNASKNNSSIKKRKKSSAAGAPRWNRNYNMILRKYVEQYGTDVEQVQAFFPGFGKDFLQKKIKKEQAMKEKTGLQDLEYHKLKALHAQLGDNWPVIGQHFPGV